MLPVVVPAPEHQAVLGPDDLGADLEAAGGQALGHRRRVQGAVPDIGHLAGEQRPGLAPVGPVVVLAPCRCGGRGAEPGAVAPGRVVLHAIGRVGDHQVRPHAGQRPLDHRRVGAVAADQAVAAEQPDVARRG